MADQQEPTNRRNLKADPSVVVAHWLGLSLVLGILVGFPTLAYLAMHGTSETVILALSTGMLPILSNISGGLGGGWRGTSVPAQNHPGQTVNVDNIEKANVSAEAGTEGTNNA